MVTALVLEITRITNHGILQKCGSFMTWRARDELNSMRSKLVYAVTMGVNVLDMSNKMTFHCLQNMNVSGFRVCIKELYETRYDPVSVSYAVLTG